MRCTSPRTVGFYADGKTLCWSQSKASKEYPKFQLPCSKCIECRLEYSRQWAVRCVHEAQMHSSNCFITLTYAPEKLLTPKLEYSDFQNFMKKLRKLQNDPIGMFVTGEYGDENKRPHWHAIIFNWKPNDMEYLRTNERGDKIYKSKTLDTLWGKNDPEKKPNEIGDVTFESAGYCARYAAKKLVHGNDDQEFKPISKKSSKHAIGKKWLEKNWPDIFNYGKCTLLGRPDSSIPRYYEKWLQKHQPLEWERYVTSTKVEIVKSCKVLSEADQNEWIKNVIIRGPFKSLPLTRNKVRAIIAQSKFKLLHNNLKL